MHISKLHICAQTLAPGRARACVMPHGQPHTCVVLCTRQISIPGTSVVVRAAQSKTTETAFWRFLTATLHAPALRQIPPPIVGQSLTICVGQLPSKCSVKGAALKFPAGFQNACAGGAAHFIQVAVAPFGRLSDCCLQCAPSGRYPIDQEVLPADRLEQFQTCAAQSSAPLRGAGQSD